MNEYEEMLEHVHAEISELAADCAVAHGHVVAAAWFAFVALDDDEKVRLIEQACERGAHRA